MWKKIKLWILILRLIGRNGIFMGRKVKHWSCVVVSVWRGAKWLLFLTLAVFWFDFWGFKGWLEGISLFYANFNLSCIFYQGWMRQKTLLIKVFAARNRKVRWTRKIILGLSPFTRILPSFFLIPKSPSNPAPFYGILCDTAKNLHWLFPSFSHFIPEHNGN